MFNQTAFAHLRDYCEHPRIVALSCKNGKQGLEAATAWALAAVAHVIGVTVSLTAKGMHLNGIGGRASICMLLIAAGDDMTAPTEGRYTPMQ